MDLGQVDLTDLDRFAGGFPHEVFAFLRREAPVWWHEPTRHTPDGVGFWVLSRYADVAAVSGDTVTYSSERAPGRDAGGTILQDLPYGFAAGVLLNMMDDPRHAKIRKVITPTVGPKAVVRMEDEMTERATRILDAIADRGSCDFLSEVAAELPLQAVAALMGVPGEDRHALMSWANATLDYGDRELGETNQRVQDAAAHLSSYGEKLIARKKACPMDDVISVLATTEVENIDGVVAPLTELELLMFFNLLIMAGSETTRNSIALGMAALIDHPDQLEALRDDRSLMPTAVDEILRWTSATLYNRRTATRDADLGGATIRAGEKVTLWWASANRDEEVFADPFAFDITRDPNKHLSFGYRSHFCLGAYLARMEVRVMFDLLLDRFENFALAGPIERVRTNKHAGVCHMPLTFDRRGPVVKS